MKKENYPAYRATEKVDYAQVCYHLVLLSRTPKNYPLGKLKSFS